MISTHDGKVWLCGYGLHGDSLIHIYSFLTSKSNYGHLVFFLLVYNGDMGLSLEQSIFITHDIFSLIATFVI